MSVVGRTMSAMFGTQKQWVTKTDLARWYRCPYAFWLLDSGQITFAESVSEFTKSLIAGGIEYEHLVEREAIEVVLSPQDLAQALQTDITILGTPFFQNKKAKLRGSPDGIDAAQGAAYPIEIKSHRAVTPLDRLELAFYWQLLEPVRTRKVPPAGVMILRKEGRPERVRVDLTDAVLNEARSIISAIRQARRRGVRPRVCGCHVCSRVRRDEVISSVTSSKDVTMIWGVGRVYARALEDAGYSTWETLADCDPGKVAAVLEEAGVKGCGAPKAASWQLHARALASGRPEFRPGARWPAEGPYIALDLEYDVTPGNDHIWLAGAAVVHPDGADYHSWWAATPEEERDALSLLAGLLAEHPDLPVVTWAGNSADVPRLLTAADRHGLPGLADAITGRHLDAYVWLQRNVRLPILSLGLNDVSGYFGYRASTAITDGLEALMRYQSWLDSRSEQLKEELTGYNRDDIGALVHTAARLADLAAAAPALRPQRSPGEHQRWSEATGS
jgi:predicted RecB family nuclease